MKKIITIAGCALLALGFSTVSVAKGKPDACATIQSGNLVASDGSTIEVGNDQWGYNYQARKFNGGFCDAYRDADWCQSYKDIQLVMKWNDAWLSNKDCDTQIGREGLFTGEGPDGILDRHLGYDSYIGSGAWTTNHQSGSYEGDNGEQCSWVYFVKIVAVPTDADPINGTWFTANGDEIGPVIWGQFAIIQEVSNDACAGGHGVQYKSPVGPGLGKF